MNEKLHPQTDVLLLNEDGSRIGQMKYFQAKSIAEAQSLDLVAISRQQSIVVCKIMDEGKWKYEQQKRKKQSQKKTLQVKEVKFGVTTAQHDIDIKVNHVKEFISKGHPVRLTIEMVGRQKTHSPMAKEKLVAIISMLGDAVRADPLKFSSNNISTLIQPTKTIVEGQKNVEKTSSSDRQQAPIQ